MPAIRVIGVILSLGMFVLGVAGLRRGDASTTDHRPPSDDVGPIPALVLGSLGLYIALFAGKAKDPEEGRGGGSRRHGKNAGYRR